MFDPRIENLQQRVTRLERGQTPPPAQIARGSAGGGGAPGDIEFAFSGWGTTANDAVDCILGKKVLADGTIDATTVKIGLPYELRRTPFDGKNVASADGNIYLHVYSQPYLRNRIKSGGTGPGTLDETEAHKITPELELAVTTGSGAGQSPHPRPAEKFFAKAKRTGIYTEAGKSSLGNFASTGWTASVADVGASHTALASGRTGPPVRVTITVAGTTTDATKGTLGSLGSNEWAFGDVDDVGTDRIYMQAATGSTIVAYWEEITLEAQIEHHWAVIQSTSSALTDGGGIASVDDLDALSAEDIAFDPNEDFDTGPLDVQAALYELADRIADLSAGVFEIILYDAEPPAAF